MEERIAKYKPGDKVKVVKYGGLWWLNKNQPQPEFYSKYNVVHETDTVKWIDIMPQMVGKIGTIVTESIVQNVPQYSIDFIDGGKSAWYTEDQLEIAEPEIKQLEFTDKERTFFHALSELKNSLSKQMFECMRIPNSYFTNKKKHGDS